MSLIADLRYACRHLVQSPGYALAAVATLALAIGANSAIFSAVNTVIVVRTAADPMSVAAAVRNAARGLNPGAIVDNVTTLDVIVGRAEAPRRLTMWLFVAFAALAFGLSALGLFSIVALDVTNRAREFAIRMALGAPRQVIMRGVIARAAWRAGAGVALGLLAAAATGRAIRGLLFGIAPADAVTYATVLVVVIVAVACAAYVPARRAGRAEPHALLRQG